MGKRGERWTTNFTTNCGVISLMLVANLVVSASYQFTDSENYHRLKRSYELPKNSKGRIGNGNVVSVDRSNIFATENSTIVEVQLGGTATLPCIVKKFSNGVVSWLRKVETPSLLTVGLNTYSADERILVEHVRHLQNWGLHIKKVQWSDAGLYECQVSTHPPTSIFIELKVAEATAEIIGSPDIHLNAGSQLRLVCTFKNSTEDPLYVFWYHEDKMINYDPGVYVLLEKSSSILQVSGADKSHDGNYTCNPSNALPASINVHVLNSTEENPAAMLHANTSTINSTSNILMIILSFLLFLKPVIELIVKR
ncbi:limbic system-associated membrane protein-like isoform X2 [Onthophagus taurus]|uniref:limbic system-associated membrane protein-like isoform X2 n=1 Tax=Onthophagus taurus TaxID=166361 RepID=UPI0039BDA6AC